MSCCWSGRVVSQCNLHLIEFFMTVSNGGTVINDHYLFRLHVCNCPIFLLNVDIVQLPLMKLQAEQACL